MFYVGFVDAKELIGNTEISILAPKIKKQIEILNILGILSYRKGFVSM